MKRRKQALFRSSYKDMAFRCLVKALAYPFINLIEVSDESHTFNVFFVNVHMGW